MTPGRSYHRISLFIFTLAGCCIFIHCSSEIPVSSTGNHLFSVTIITPPVIKSGERFPVIIRSGDAHVRSLENMSVNILVHTSSGILEKHTVKVKKGVCSISSTLTADEKITISTDECIGERELTLRNNRPQIHHSGVITAAEAIWDASADHCITSNLTIPSGTTLIIQKGARVVSGGSCNLLVKGSLQCLGTAENPVFFTSADRAQPWGGIEITDGNGYFDYCIFTNGGADSTRSFAHAHCQPVTFADRSALSVRNCFYIDNIGKALGSVESTVDMHASILSRCTTGGEFHFSAVTVTDCHIIDIPNGDGRFIDNDNDGFYFLGRHPEIRTPSRVSNSFFITGKDDAIDHNNARLSVENCWIEGFLHEGIAASEGDTVTVYNSVISDCEQGIEAGYGAPFVIVDHCVLTGNGIGLRFGDSYETAASGHLTASNTVLHSNTDDIHVYDRNPDSATDDCITVSYSLFNDTAFQSAPFCISETPLFNTHFCLSEQSPGFSSGSDRTSMGLVKELW